MDTLSIALLTVVGTIPWWVMYFTRLYHAARHRNLLQMPHLYLWLNLYGTGLVFYLGQYDLEYRLHSYLLALHFPLVSLTKIIIATGLVTYGYILVVRRYTALTITRKIDPVIISFIGLLVLLNLVLYERMDYFKVQIMTNVLYSLANLSGAVAILPIMRHFTRSRLNQVREVHHAWMVVLLVTCGLSAVLLLVDGVYKLVTNATSVYSPILMLSVACQCICMLAVAFLIGPDRYLYWVYYPRQLKLYFKLKRLQQRIYRQAQLGPTYAIPIPRIPTLSALEFANYRLFVNIMDGYRSLPGDSPLSLNLQSIDRANASYEETLQQLQKLA